VGKKRNRQYRSRFEIKKEKYFSLDTDNVDGRGGERGLVVGGEKGLVVGTEIACKLEGKKFVIFIEMSNSSCDNYHMIAVLLVSYRIFYIV